MNAETKLKICLMVMTKTINLEISISRSVDRNDLKIILSVN